MCSMCETEPYDNYEEGYENGYDAATFDTWIKVREILDSDSNTTAKLSELDVLSKKHW